jgi:hypothetical protein
MARHNSESARQRTQPGQRVVWDGCQRNYTKNKKISTSAVGFQRINFRSQDEIRFGQSVDGMSPDTNLNLPPGESDVWMMAELFCQFTHPIHTLKSGKKIREPKDPDQVMCVLDLPLWNL